jgi:hypothetical protein
MFRPCGKGTKKGNIILIYIYIYIYIYPLQPRRKKLHGLSPQANYTDRVTAACQRNDCQLLRIEGAMWSS